MKLRNKLKAFAMDNHIKKYAKHNAKQLEQIADDFAIEFGEWIINVYYANPKWEYKSINELLNQFKKEKRL